MRRKSKFLCLLLACLLTFCLSHAKADGEPSVITITQNIPETACVGSPTTVSFTVKRSSGDKEVATVKIRFGETNKNHTLTLSNPDQGDETKIGFAEVIKTGTGSTESRSSWKEGDEFLGYDINVKITGGTVTFEATACATAPGTYSFNTSANNSDTVSDTVVSKMEVTQAGTPNGQDAPKSSAPGIENKIIAGDGTLATDMDAAPGDKVTLRISSNVPDTLGDFINIPPADPPSVPAKALNTMSAASAPPERGSYKLTFHNKFDPGMTFDQNSVEVTVNGHELAADLYTLANYPEDDHLFHIEMDIVKIYEAGGYFTMEEIGSAPPIEVTCSASVDEGAGHGAYSAESWVAFEDGESAHSFVRIHIYAIDVFSYDQRDDSPLAGGEFALYNEDPASPDAVPAATGVSGADGTLVFEGLRSGTYYLKETKAPNGYVKSDSALKVDVAPTTGMEKEAHAVNARFANSAIPHTGGSGTKAFTVAGGAIMAAAAGTFLLSRKKGKGDA